tara:strand:- start:808 stop:1017 length:210 start_codon:yes stop_codon:yes gene_type:complete
MFKELVQAKNSAEAINAILSFALMVLISTFLLRFLWNQGLVKHITVFKPVSSLMDAFLLSLGLGVLKCC